MKKAIYAGSVVISLDAGYQGDAEDFQPERQLIRRPLYCPTGPVNFLFILELYTIGLLFKKKRPFSFILGSVPIFQKTLFISGSARK